jgi:signal transduction histidine kinase
MAAPAEVSSTTSHPESEASTLQTVVELVRRIMHADVASILSYSLDDEAVTWKAASGFRSPEIDYQQPVLRPFAAEFAQRALAENTVVIFEGIGLKPELPAENFPVHVAEGIHDLAVAPLPIQGNRSGAVTAGFRTRHHFTEDEKRLLQDLAAMAAVALDSARLLETVSTAEKIWGQTFDAIGEGILVYDERRQIIRCNARAAEMIDMHPALLIKLTFDDAFARLLGPEAAAYYLAQHRSERSVFEAQTEFGRRYLISIFSLNRGGESVSVASWNDVTRLSEVQEQLARSRRLGSVGQLAAGVAHEINNPLAAIATCAEAIMRDLRREKSLQGVADEHQWSYYLEEIVRQAMRCKEITRGLLDLTQQRQARRALCDINHLARQCAKAALEPAGSANVEIEISLNENIGEVATDASMVRQIVDNLLSNAVDALGDKGGKVTITTARDGDRAVIEVTDDGPGIPAGLIPRVFDPFMSTKGPGKNYGLGLAICAALAESLGGSLTVESKEGEGSRFRLWIPRRAPEK